MDWPTKEQIRASILAIWKAERPDADSTKYSDLWLFSRVASVIVYRLHKTIKQALDAVFPTTSYGAYLDSWLSWVGLEDGQGGFGRILPHISAAEKGFTVETVAGMGAGAVPVNAELTDSAGNVYRVTETNGVIAPGGTEDLDIESITTGYTVNLEAGTVLTWVTPPVGADATGTLAKDLTGGKDLGEDSSEQTRLLSRLRNPPASGNVASWVATIEAVSPGNLTAYVWGKRQNYPYGYGLTDYCALYKNESGTDRHIAAADDMYTDIENAVAAALPALIYRNSRQLTMTTTAVPVELTIELGGSASEDQKCDWDAVSANPVGANKTTVAGTVFGTLTISAAGSVTSPTLTYGIAAGDKVVIDGYEVTCASVTNATDFTIDAWPAAWPTGAAAMNGLNITAGGGFIGYKTDYDNAIEGTGCIEAIREYLDSGGPNASYNGAQAQIPGWHSSVLIQKLESACFVVGGGIIEAVTVALPVGDLTHLSESDATPHIFDVTEITVWQVFV